MGIAKVRLISPYLRSLIEADIHKGSIRFDFKLGRGRNTPLARTTSPPVLYVFGKARGRLIPLDFAPYCVSLHSTGDLKTSF